MLIIKPLTGGGAIAEILEDKSIGVVGFGGAHFLPSVPMYWSESPIISEYCKHNDNGREYDCMAKDYMINGLVDVAVVDGMCMMARRDVFDKVKFDEDSYSGFHLYDMDVCMQILKQGLRVCVTDKILITHHWSESAMFTKKGANMLKVNLDVFVNKWRNRLPMLVGLDNTKLNIENLDKLCCSVYLGKKIRCTLAYRIGKFLLHPNVKNWRLLINK